MCCRAVNAVAPTVRWRKVRRANFKFVMICSTGRGGDTCATSAQNEKERGFCPPTTWSLPLKSGHVGTVPSGRSMVRLSHSRVSPEEDTTATDAYWAASDYSGLILAVLTTLRHFSVSSARCLLNAAGVIGSGTLLNSA